MTATSIVNLPTQSLVEEFSGGSDTDIAMMIGIGVIKESDAVYFQYMGNEQAPQPLMLPRTGKPVTRLQGVVLAGIDVATDVGEFKATKLNLVLQSSAGRKILLTSGLKTIWSQCVLTALMGMFNEQTLGEPFNFDTWKGNSKLKPCFCAIRQNGLKISDQMLYDQLANARADRASDVIEKVLIDSVQILQEAIKQESVSVAIIEETDNNTEEF